ncbi:cilium assembly protein DZIP1 [Poeciliopsis prolifica]|uniref:cilium assembly protein DZIP1 n=1 Tax=Poeciliopsis prolifica TaxID=188132 RepID=UPI002413FBBA|nr:cilium assembly protein DZIP1 [Poeciliopsis prolifica]
MPFHDGVYYPYGSDTQGTHSSAGIPSLLNSPLSQQSAVPGMVPAAFKFRPRRQSVDWRRLNAVDVDLVASQLDVDTLQEHIGTVTFCSLDAERCQRCQSPVDPALINLLRLAQLTVEWLLHCQEILSANLRGAEERLAAAAGEREQLLALLRKQEEKAKALMGELKQRKKVIRTQQSLLAPRIMSSHKCGHCDKSFLNSSFLHNHIQRRHPDEHHSQLQSDSEKKSQIDSLKKEISSLKDQITQQQQDLQAKIAQEKEQQSMHKDLLRDLERFKAEEMARMDKKLEDSRDGMRREMEFLYNRNFQALTEANQNQTAKQEKPSSPVNSQAHRHSYNDVQLQAIHKLEQQMKKQDKRWESRIKELKAQHESEKNQLLNELSKMQASVTEHQEQSQRLQQEMDRRLQQEMDRRLQQERDRRLQEEMDRRLQQEMDRRLQDKAQTVKAQREQVRSISYSPPTTVQEIPVAASPPVPEPKPKKVSLEEPASALKLDPIQELSEEEKDYSISEKRVLSSKHVTEAPKKAKMSPSAVKKNPSIKKEMRAELERSLTKKLESLGVKPNQKGLTNKEYGSFLAKVRLKQDAVAKTMPDYWRCWEETASTVQLKLGGQEEDVEAAPRPKQSHYVMQVRPRSSSLPSRSSQAVPAATVTQPKTPQPTPRTKGFIQLKTSTSNVKPMFRISTSKTPPFSSDEDSLDSQSDLDEEQPDRVNSLNLTLQIKPPVLSRQGAVSQSSSSSKPQQSRHGATKAQSDDDDEEWSDVSDMAEIDFRHLRGFKNYNNSNDKGIHSKDKVADLARKVEEHISERPTKKPAGGVSVFPERKDEVQELSLTDLEESSEWMVSSLEDKPGASKQTSFRVSGPLRKSLDSSSTSVWGTSTGKAPKSGPTEAGAGSTLKSSLCSFSDISDSEDISNK